MRTSYNIEKIREITLKSVYKEIKRDIFEAAKRGYSEIKTEALAPILQEKLKKEGYSVRQDSLTFKYYHISWY